MDEKQLQLKAVADLIAATISSVDVILSHPEFAQLKIGIKAQLSKPQGRLNSMLGTHNAMTSTHQVPDPGPVTTFLGKNIQHGATPVMPADTVITLDEREKFLLRRDDVYSRFTKMSDDQVISLMREPQGTTIIRSVAKKAGLEDYETAKLNTGYYMEIRRMIQVANDRAEQIKTGDDGAEQLRSAQRDLEASEEDDDDYTGEEFDADSITLKATATPAAPAPAPAADTVTGPEEGKAVVRGAGGKFTKKGEPNG